MDAFVADASIALAWVHPAQATDESMKWREHVDAGAVIVVPGLWSLEIANALIVLQRRRRITAAERIEATRALSDLPIEYDHDASSRAPGEVSAIAQEEGLSIYDAVYLDLAERRRLPLACKDATLRAVAVRRRLPVQP